MVAVTRRSVLGAALLFGAPSAGAASSGDLGLELRPTRVYKTPDRGHENTESWIFSLLVQVASPLELEPAAMRVELLRGGKILRTTDYPAAGLAPLTFQTSLPRRRADGAPLPAPVRWPFVVRLRHTEPVALGVDAMRIRLDAAEEGGATRCGEITVPIETYAQKTALIFPFKGKGIILQASATNGGHRNRSGAFALDAFGLDDAWSIIAAGPAKRNDDYRGWNRPLLAPADGKVVRLRTDRPDQPVADVSDPAFYAPEYPNGGDPGNHLVIDHGDDEFSMIAHFQAGSIEVAEGSIVRQGQELGRLGHSGDTSGPHVHYQLQSAPNWEYADALPCRFTNVSEQILDRGTYFEAT